MSKNKDNSKRKPIILDDNEAFNLIARSSSNKKPKLDQSSQLLAKKVERKVFKEFKDQAYLDLYRYVAEQQEFLRKEQPAELRKDQTECLEQIANLIDQDKNIGYLVLPTGYGKTRTFLSVIKAMNFKQDIPSLIVVPNNELVKQTVENLDNANERLKAIKKPLSFAQYNCEASPEEKAKCNTSDVVIITWQSLIAQFKKPEAERQLNLDRFGIVVLDEVHTLLSGKLNKMVSELKKDKLVIGFTATDKFDNKRDKDSFVEVKQLLENEIYQMTLSEALDKDLLTPTVNVIVPVDHKVVPASLRKRHKKTNKRDDNKKQEKDFTQAELEKLNIAKLNKVAVSIYSNYADENGKPLLGRKAIAFCAGINHAEAVAKEFNNSLKNHPFVIEKKKSNPNYRVAACIHGNMDFEERKRIIEDYKKGNIDILTGADVLTIGFDVPEVEIGFNMAPTKSTVKAMQRGGRIIRKSENKKFAYIFDFDYGINQKFYKEFIENKYKLGTKDTDFSLSELHIIDNPYNFDAAEFALCDNEERYKDARIALSGSMQLLNSERVEETTREFAEEVLPDINNILNEFAGLTQTTNIIVDSNSNKANAADLLASINNVNIQFSDILQNTNLNNKGDAALNNLYKTILKLYRVVKHIEDAIYKPNEISDSFSENSSSESEDESPTEEVLNKLPKKKLKRQINAEKVIELFNTLVHATNNLMFNTYQLDNELPQNAGETTIAEIEQSVNPAVEKSYEETFGFVDTSEELDEQLLSEFANSFATENNISSFRASIEGGLVSLETALEDFINNLTIEMLMTSLSEDITWLKDSIKNHNESPNIHRKFCELLVDAHPLVDLKNEPKKSQSFKLIQEIIKYGYNDLLTKLIENDKEYVLSYADWHNDSALHYAAKEGNIGAVNTLVNVGADPLAKNNSNQPPLANASNAKPRVGHKRNIDQQVKDAIKRYEEVIKILYKAESSAKEQLIASSRTYYTSSIQQRPASFAEQFESKANNNESYTEMFQRQLDAKLGKGKVYSFL
jgi:superfamily II DNA or RNA helicase